MRELGKGLAVTLVAAIVSIAGWMLVFVHFPIVPDGTTYPENWLSLTSGEQVEWLRTHTVVLRGFEGSVYMLKHFSEYAKEFVAMFTMTRVSAAVAVAMWWHLTRKDFNQADSEDTGSLERFRRPVPDKER